MSRYFLFAVVALFSTTGGSQLLEPSRNLTTAPPFPATPTNGTVRTTATANLSRLPIPTGSPPEYPNPGDCNGVDDDQNPGWLKWKSANANETFNCFKSLYEKDPNFDGGQPYDQLLARYYGFSNPDFQCSIDPSTPAAFCQDDDRSCEDLQPRPLQPGQSTMGYACDPNNTNLHHKATGWVLRQSMLNLNAYFTASFAAVEQAVTNAKDATGPNGNFKNDFTAPPSDSTTPNRVELAIMNGMFSLAYAAIGLLPGATIETTGIGFAAAFASGGTSIGMSNASVPADTPDLQGWIGNITEHLTSAYKSYSDSIFRAGYVTIKAWAKATPQNVTLFDLIDNGTFAGEMDFGGNNQTAINLIEQGLYAALAQKCWTAAGGFTPFIRCVDSPVLPFALTLQQRMARRLHRSLKAAA